MKLSFRWYNEDDPINIDYIRQIPSMKSIVTSLYNNPIGEVWDVNRINELKEKVEEVGLDFHVIESVPVHEDIKLGLSSRDKYIENYKINIRNLGKAGVKVICYNFMPIFGWIRSQLDKELEDKSRTLVYYREQVERMNPMEQELALPGWGSVYSKEKLDDLFNKYSKVEAEDLWSNLEYFLKEIIPVAEESNVKMAIHPDDPPWTMFGLPRIISNEKDIDRFLKLVDNKYNGLTLCTGSLGAGSFNDIPKMVDKYASQGRIHFMHIRNVKLLNDGSFEESAHYSSYGSLDIVEIIKALHKNNFDGYIRPDHGRMIWGETGIPGYGLYDRALGAMYIAGIWETLDKTYK